MTTTTRPAPVTTAVAAETYLGHEVAITETVVAAHIEPAYSGTFRDGTTYSRPAREVAEWRGCRAVIDGRSFRCPTGTDEQVLAKLRKSVDVQVADDAIRATLTAYIHATRDASDLAPVEAPVVGALVYVYAMGMWRRGVVTAVKRTRIEVAYTTASSNGRIFRKAVAHGDARFA
ncbi:MAG: hypothetical protein QOK11_1345 [Pseudonocardiales bacterium]|nr:hypothetical protein [Pseudonocardiales bacterium]